MEVTEKNNFCVILAGGRGQRLWPASRNSYPKQFIDFFGTGQTMLQTTYERFTKILPKENIYVCSCKGYLDLLHEQLPELSEENILLEPVHRNTAPSVAWATMRILSAESRLFLSQHWRGLGLCDGEQRAVGNGCETDAPRTWLWLYPVG